MLKKNKNVFKIQYQTRFKCAFNSISTQNIFNEIIFFKNIFKRIVYQIFFQKNIISDF